MGTLNGIRVIDLSRFQACPLCGMVLADMGAEVIRLEPPEGAPDRTWGQLGPDGETLLFKVAARNKKSITLDLKSPEGKDIFQKLVGQSDVVLHNFTPGAPIAKEINYPRLKEINESIIVAAVSGYGQNGPDAENPCFDGTAQARAGSMPLNGFPGDPPLKPGLPYIDVTSGLCAAIGVILALYHREKTGKGQSIDVSLFDTALFANQSVGNLMLYQLFGEIRQQIGNRGFHSFNGCFKAKDKWVMVATATNHNGPCRGGIVMIDPSKGANAKEAVTNLTPEVDIYAHRLGGGPFGNGRRNGDRHRSPRVAGPRPAAFRTGICSNC